MKKNELKKSLNRFAQAVKRLEEGVVKGHNDLEKDGVIQRFEFTFELLWKCLMIFLENKGVVCKTPKDCLKQAFRIGLIEDDKVYLRMLEDRNMMSHLYSREESREVFDRVKGIHLPVMRALAARLKKEGDE